MTNQINKAPAGATHLYEHANNVDWYCQTDRGLYRWQQGSWCASVHKDTKALADSCPLGRLEAIPAQPVEDDLTWLARNVHKWKSGLQGWCYVLTLPTGRQVVNDHNLCKLPGTRVEKQDWLARRAELQNKPSWADAPEWVTHMAQRYNGRWLFLRCGELGDVTWKASKILGCDGPAGEVLGDWRDTLEQRPADLSEPAVTQRLDEATQNVLAAAPGLVSEKFKLELPPSQHKWVIGDAASPSTVMMDGNEQSAEQHVPGGLAVQMTNTLKKSPFYFTSNELMDIQFLIEDELTKRDAAVCGGEHGKKFVLVLGDGTFGLVESGCLTWTLSLERATLMAEHGWEQFKRFGNLAEVRHGKLVMRVGASA